MRKITEIKSVISAKHLLTPHQMLKVKGGLFIQDDQGENQDSQGEDLTGQICSALDDDKRRARPGGGASTQLF